MRLIPVGSVVKCTLPEPDRLFIGEALVPNRLSDFEGLSATCPFTAGDGGNSLRVTGYKFTNTNILNRFVYFWSMSCVLWLLSDDD